MDCGFTGLATLLATRSGEFEAIAFDVIRLRFDQWKRYYRYRSPRSEAKIDGSAKTLGERPDDFQTLPGPAIF